MSPQLITLYRFTESMCEALMADIRPDEMEIQPHPDVNTPAWILGHLAICTDFALQLMDRPTRLPAEWHAQFGPTTSPLAQGTPFPSRDELLNAYRDGHRAVVEALGTVDAAKLAAPNPLGMPFLQRTLPTAGDLLAHLLSTHEAAHLGHLSNWRRQMGRPPLF
jgi:hypothetical protein